MRYVSTRGDSARPPFATVLLEGPAPDGGLYLPEEWPQARSASTYPETVAAALRPFVTPDPVADDLAALAEAAFVDFRHPDIAPLRTMGDDLHVLELFWGPTLSFKDHGMQMLGLLFDAVLARQNRRVTVLGATSGDTGSAAIAACSGRPNLDVVILYPDGRVTEFQRRQMTTVPDANVQAVAVEGNFDDCQDLVKQAFADQSLTKELVAVNSINFARVAAQAGYYRWAAGQLGSVEVDFSVPTGNFGNAFTGWAAKRTGAGVGRLTIANNENHGLTDLVRTGTLRLSSVNQTLSPSMDVGIPSNLERYLFELSGRDPAQVREWQTELRLRGEIVLEPSLHRHLQQDFQAMWTDDSTSLTTIKQVYEEWGILLDPHSAVGYAAAVANKRPGVPMVALATADPAKFAPAVRAAIGVEPPIPAAFDTLLTATERLQRIPNEYEALASLLVA